MLATIFQVVGLLLLAVVVATISLPAGAVVACCELILIGHLMEAE